MKCAACLLQQCKLNAWLVTQFCVLCYVLPEQRLPRGTFSFCAIGKKEVVPGYNVCWFLLISCARFFKSSKWLELLPLEMRCGDRAGVGGVILRAGQQGESVWWVPTRDPWVLLETLLRFLGCLCGQSDRFLPWTGQLAPLPSQLSGFLLNPLVKYKLKAVFKCRGFGFAHEFTVKGLII